MKPMQNTTVRRLCRSVLVVLITLAATPAMAQFQPRRISNPATGESYHIEAAIGLWMPSADMQVSSEQFGIPGTRVDFKEDLGLEDQRFPEMHLVLRPALKHKFRFQYIPITYTQGPVTVTRDIVFNGQLYSIGVNVESNLDWRAYRFGYEYDFLTKDRFFAGFVLDFKYTDVSAGLEVPGLIREEVHAAAPIPAIGGIFRGYVMPNISITGELTAFKVPEGLIEDSTGRYFDLDIYGTVNFTNNIGAMFGYRSLDVGYTIETDLGDFRLKGLYAGAVVRY
jgi:hypothetical protein